MNKQVIVVVAVVVGFIAGVSLFIGAQAHQRNVNAELLREEQRAVAYHECTYGLSYAKYNDGTIKFFNDRTGEWVSDDAGRLEARLQFCNENFGKK